MRVFDASSMIYAWDNYPEAQFPALWDWMAIEFTRGIFVIPRVAFDEIGHKAPDCISWLRAKAITPVGTENAVVQEALRIKGLLGIVNDEYGKGVDENDLFIIATAKFKGFDLVSEEGRQTVLPAKIANMKIPAVCAHTSVVVTCITFVELIKQSGVIFR